jgi:hypothetical protein
MSRARVLKNLSQNECAGGQDQDEQYGPREETARKEAESHRESKLRTKSDPYLASVTKPA